MFKFYVSIFVLNTMQLTVHQTIKVKVNIWKLDLNFKLWLTDEQINPDCLFAVNKVSFLFALSTFNYSVEVFDA